MTIKLVAWDFDGVLNRDETDFDRVNRHFERALGLSFNRFVAFHFSERRFEAVVTGTQTIEALFGTWLAREGAKVEVSDLIAWWLDANNRPDPGMIRLVERLHQPQVIATNNETRRADHIRDAAGWAGRVERVFASGEMGVAKPDPAFFARVAEWAECAPDEILLVDDSHDNIQAARACGWQAFHFTDTTRSNLPARLGL